MFSKIRNFFQNKKEFEEKRIRKIKTIEEKWAEFENQSTYLTYHQKGDFIDEINSISKIPWKYKFDLRYYFGDKLYKEKISEIKSRILNFNKNFVERRLEDYSSFFEGLDDDLKYPLDMDQRKAIIKDDMHNLVVAGAGSGKTSVLTSRIAYLIRRRDYVEKERILALAFTRVAAKEMEERLKRDFGIEIDISTFHSLGWNIIKEETGQRPQLLFNGNERDIFKLVQDIFKRLLQGTDFQDLLVGYLAYHIEQEVKKESFEDKEEYYKYMRNKKYSALNGIEVKSISERDIANFLFMHNIPFEYEPLVEWIDKSRGTKSINNGPYQISNSYRRQANGKKEKFEADPGMEDDKEYRPDFYLPEQDIYIEHWGLDKFHNVPEWFTITSQEYLELREWKLTQFEMHQKTLVETWQHEKNDGILLERLKEKLKSQASGMEFNRLSYEDLVEKTHEFKEKRDEIINLIFSFIKIAKSNFLNVDEIYKRVNSKEYTEKQRSFGHMAHEVYKGYQEELQKRQKIDFNDMINLAVELVQRDPEKYNKKYDHVLVDEFQDISYQRLQLIKGFVNENSKTKLFCVGDDWQSIYQFTGSDVRFFLNFEDYFPHPEITYLGRNYRSTQKIVQMSNDLIDNNEGQFDKDIRSMAESGVQPLLFKFAKTYEYSMDDRITHLYNFVQLLINEGVDPADIMVIARFNHYLKKVEIRCGANGIPTEYKAGGVRFYSAHASKGSECQHVVLIDLTSGLYGFPCEIEDSSVMELAKRFESDGFIEEERRLFYVALTRSKKFLYLFTLENNESMFLDEIDEYLKMIYIDSLDVWRDFISEFMNLHIKGAKIDPPMICPECGKKLERRSGKYGEFLGCVGYPQCKFIHDLAEDDDMKCPLCGRKLVKRKGKYGEFLGCIGYPKCTYSQKL